jgi:hypothetical protein
MVAALALPDEQSNRSLKIGDRILTPTVGWATAGSDGAFSLPVDPTLVAAGHRSATGQVNLELIAWNGIIQTQFFMPVQLSVTVASPTATSRPVTAGLTLRLKDPIVRPSSLIGRVQSSPNIIVCYYYLISTYLAWDDVGESYPYPGSQTTSWFSIGTNHSSTLGAATSYTGGYGTWSASGSYSISAGVTTSWGASTADRIYQIQTEYGKYVNHCSGYATFPIQPTGGTNVVAATAPDWCNYYDVPMSGGVTFTRNSSSGNDFNLSGGVLAKSVLGINLSLDSKYSSDRSLSYHYKYPGYLCGNNSYPATAGRINEGSPWSQR